MSRMIRPSFEVHLSAFLLVPVTESSHTAGEEPEMSENLSVLFIHQNLGASLEETACLYKYE